MPKQFDNIPRKPDDLAAILYTSGTTGRSKGAMLSHENLLSNSQTLVSLWRFTKDDVLLHALPIFHTHGLFVAINVVMLSGCSMNFIPGFNLDTMIDNLPKSTVLMGVPTFYTRLLKDPRFTRELVSHMRLFVSGSAPLLAETHLQFEECTGHRVLERYGMTETNMNTSNPYDGERRAGTVGFPLPGVLLKITDPETGDTIENGEIVVITKDGVESLHPFPKVRARPCIFEYIYFARPDSVVNGKSVYAVRKAIDAAGHPALLFVDGISSIGSLPFKMDEWGVDCAIAGSQKGFMLPAGLGLICISPKALKIAEGGTGRNDRLGHAYFAWKIGRASCRERV